ncbi:hypothetical protein D047_2672A, partial [Vibrio parahaemolyticus VPTS-2010_2]
MRSRQCS